MQISAQASGSSYQWQFQDGNGNWQNYTEGNIPGYATFSGTTTPTLNVSNISNLYSSYFEKVRLLVYSGKANFIASNTAQWSVEKVDITTQPPTSLTACVGGNLNISATASGASTYQWQYQDNNGNWNNYTEGNVPGYATFSGTKTSALTISNISGLYTSNSEKTRLLVTGAGGCSVASKTVYWKAENVSITSQPNTLQNVCVGRSLNISATASGASKYQWQFQDSNGNWNNYTEGNVPGYATFSGTKTSALTISNISGLYTSNTERTRLLVTGAGGCSVASKTVSWKAENVSITSQPTAPQSICVGGSISLSAIASGAATYQWQYQTSSGSWNNFTEGIVSGYGTFSGTKTSKMTISNLANIYTNHVEKTRLVVTGAGGCTIISNTVSWTASNCTGKISANSKGVSVDEKNGTDIKMNNTQSVYPNPVKDELTVNLGNSKNSYQVQIFSTTGQIVYQTITSDTILKIPFSDKPAANYLVVIKNTSDGSHKTFKIIKI
ncbi:T9SS type A sorting domain-containing protein [Chryseobacterium sp. JUb7]|uniref:T9SS type A sorting domain-containing protein n=1 Tax=Chryseobacterium sp. JUb7 TaxID=2940599 RepID=UPI0021675FDE|nr:T9SS type A sorting domain-containing protein [Chryseobacterium sp. JUb7]MCS3531879.1 hypothetical protein [Chryseobacterium sp. JUb7]